MKTSNISVSTAKKHLELNVGRLVSGFSLRATPRCFKDSVPLCVCTYFSHYAFCVLHRFVSYLFIYFSQRVVLIFCLPKAWVIQVALSSTVCLQDETVCVCASRGKLDQAIFLGFFGACSSRWTCMEGTHTTHTACSHSSALHTEEVMNGSGAVWRVGVCQERAAYVWVKYVLVLHITCFARLHGP